MSPPLSGARLCPDGGWHERRAKEGQATVEANRTRAPTVAEKLFREMYGRLASLAPKFIHPKQKGRLARFRRRRIGAVDSTVLPLTHKAIDWAKHRRRKVPAKLHIGCDVASRMPVSSCA